jgi:hypothetical protein
MHRAAVAFWQDAMSGPRNKPAFERSQAVRAAIEQVLLEHVRRQPFARALTAKQINGRLPSELRLTDDTVRWHVRIIRSHHANLSLADATS